MSSMHYFVEKDHDSNGTKYLEYDKIKGYKITPKTKKEDAILVNKIVFASPSLSEKIIKKKINNAITKLLDFIKKLDDDDEGSDASAIKQSLMKAEKLRISIITKYIKYLGNNYGSLTLKKMELIINKLETELYKAEVKENYLQYLYTATYEDEKETRKGKGR